MRREEYRKKNIFLGTLFRNIYNLGSLDNYVFRSRRFLTIEEVPTSFKFFRGPYLYRIYILFLGEKYNLQLSM